MLGLILPDIHNCYVIGNAICVILNLSNLSHKNLSDVCNRTTAHLNVTVKINIQSNIEILVDFSHNTSSTVIRIVANLRGKIFQKITAEINITTHIRTKLDHTKCEKN